MKAFIHVLLFCLLAGCHEAPLNFEGGNASEAIAAKSMAPPPRMEKAVDLAAPRKLIRTGAISLTVSDAGAARTEVEKICHQYNAYVSSETQSNYGEALEYHQVIRVPSSNFDEVVKRIEALGVEVIAKNIETSDVTAEFMDTEARIKTKKQLENRYREIVAQATKVADILAIEAELNEVRSEIEVMEGRIRYLSNQVDYSTLNVTMSEVMGVESGFGLKIVAAVRNGWDMLLTMVIGILNLWPFVLLGTGIVFLVRRFRFRTVKVPSRD